jgi:hypothetical protein
MFFSFLSIYLFIGFLVGECMQIKNPILLPLQMFVVAMRWQDEAIFPSCYYGLS